MGLQPLFIRDWKQLSAYLLLLIFAHALQILVVVMFLSLCLILC